MSRVLTVALCLLSTALPVAAQTTGGGYVETLSGSMAASTNAMHKNIRRELAEAARIMSAAEYSFKPTPDVRSFAQLVGHVANANFFLCAQAKGEKSPATGDYEQTADKDALVKALETRSRIATRRTRRRPMQRSPSWSSWQRRVRATKPRGGRC